MLKNNKYYYEDCYMYFTFNGIHSSVYNLFIQSKNDLKIENTIGAKSSFVSAAFQEGNYYTGTEKTQKTFKRKCAAEGLTLSQYKAMMKWLTVGTTGFLVFDSNPYWGWTVVLDTVGDATFMDGANNLVVEFELTFKTIGTYLARNRYPAYCDVTETMNDGDGSVCNYKYNTTMCCNEYGIPVIYYEKDDDGQPINNIYYIQSVSNVHQHLNFTYVGNSSKETGLDIEYNNVKYINLATKISSNNQKDFIIDYLGESNLILADNTIIELQDELLKYNYQGNGILQLPGETPVLLTSVKVEGGQIIMDKDEIDQLINNNYNFICFTREISDNTAMYDNTQWNVDEFPIKYETYLFLIGPNIDGLEAALQNTINNKTDYVNYLINSSMHVYLNTDNVDFNSQISTETESISNAKISFSSYMKNSLLSSDIDWSLFKCYMGKSHLVTINCENDNDSKYLTVVSCNNL